MSQWKPFFSPEYEFNMTKETMNDLYRLSNKMPLEGESPERWLATKVPQRRNKDYRARLRNFVAGYPVLIINLNYLDI